MSLYRRGDVWHYDFTLDGYRHRGSTGFKDQRAASRFEERERDRLALGSGYRGSLALESIAAAWFSARITGTRSEVGTARRVRTMVRLLGPQTPITAIDAPHVAEAIAARRMEPTRNSRASKAPRAPSNATINRDLIDTTLRPILRYARKTLKLPVKEIDWADLRLQEPAERVRSFSAAEISVFREALPRWHRPLFDFISRYGVRLKEAFFDLGALDLDAGVVTLRKRKRGPDHSIPLLPEDVRSLAALAGRAREAGLDTVWFRQMKDSSLRPIHWRGYQSASAAALRAAKIPDARPVHDLRHHAGTVVLRHTGNLQVAKKLLGHENIRSTSRYAHAYHEDVLDALRHTSATAPTAKKNKSSKNKG